MSTTHRTSQIRRQPFSRGAMPVMAFVATSLLAACSDSTPPKSTPAPLAGVVLTNQNGDLQSAPILTPVPNVLSVHVTSNSGNVSGIPVYWSASDSGQLNPAVSVTDANGIAITIWQLGRKVGKQLVVADLDNVAPHVSGRSSAFSATGLPAAGSVLALYAGDRQSIPMNFSPYALQALVVHSVDAYGQESSTVPTVTWSVLDGPLEIVETSATATPRQSASVRHTGQSGMGHVRATWTGKGTFADFAITVTAALYRLNIVTKAYDDATAVIRAEIYSTVDTIPVGATLHFVNRAVSQSDNGDAPQDDHQIVSVGTPSFLSSPVLRVGDQYDVTFAVPGTYRFADPKYPSAQGQVVVR